MGIPELWNKLGDGEITSLPKLSADCFTRKGRPFRVAIDEAGWRFNNLNEAQVYAIQQKSDQPAYRGIEKNTFYRVAKLLQKNIQPLFVFDGPARPWKKGRPSGRVAYEKTQLLKQLLAVLKIPYHEAPGEAEAECARLQMEGVVDAVWSEDADALMFGCDFLIRDYRISRKKSETPANGCKSHTKKSGDLVRVYRMEQVRRSLGIDREGIVCFTVLAGGDYDATGLPGCGASNALKAAKHGPGKSLCAYKSKQDLELWRSELASFCQRKFDIPFGFPKELALKHYVHPKVSPVERLHDLRGLRKGWDAPLDEEPIRVFISERFNMWTKSYMDWIGPILLVRSLIGTSSGQKTNKHDVRLARTRKKKADDEENEALTPDAEVKLKFLATSVSSLQYNSLDDGHWDGVVGTPHEPEYRVECEILNCFLRQALPDEVLQHPVAKKAATKSKKREADTEDFAEGSKRPAKLINPPLHENDAEQPAKKRRRVKNTEKKSNDPPMPAVTLPPKAVFRLPTSFTDFPEPFMRPAGEASATYLPQQAPLVITSPVLVDDSSEDDPDLRFALELSRREADPSVSMMRPSLTSLSQSLDETEMEATQLKLAMELSRRENKRSSLQTQLRKHIHDVAPKHSAATDSTSEPPRVGDQQFPSSASDSSAVQIEPSPAQLRAARLAHFQNAAPATADNPQSRTYLTKTPVRNAVVVNLTDD